MENELTLLLSEHSKHYPLATTKDYIKLLYQNEFGGGHLIQDPTQSLEMLESESKSLPEHSLFIEDIGNGLSRLYFGSKPELSLESINKMFVNTAKETNGSVESFKKKLELLVEFSKQENIGIDTNQLLCEINSYSKKGYPVLSHSDVYKQSYCPAYRIISNQFTKFIPLFIIIERELQLGNTFCITIDGGCTSGKSTLANNISTLYDCNVFHMDDYFLQPFQHTLARLAEAGGNIDYERFEAQIVNGILSKKAFTYNKYDCSTDSIGEDIFVLPKQLNIVEGVYSQHPKIPSYYNWSLFLNVDYNTQLERLKIRNPSLLNKFINEWIPKENIYFEKFSIKQNCNQVF